MTPEKQRIAIAEACGWNSIREQDYDHGYSGNDVCQMWMGLNPDSDEFEQLPDYLTDLNAMHEAEKVLSPATQPARGESQWSEYLGWLGYCGKNKTHVVYGCVTATAAQRAEAFLRTIEKWEGE